MRSEHKLVEGFHPPLLARHKLPTTTHSFVQCAHAAPARYAEKGEGVLQFQLGMKKCFIYHWIYEYLLGEMNPIYSVLNLR